MREERMKQAVIAVSKNAGLAVNASACERAMARDTAEGYRDALHEISKHPYYAVNDSVVKRALED